MPMSIKMQFFTALALALLFLSAPGFAEPADMDRQTESVTPERQKVETSHTLDTPPGYPYNIGGRSSPDSLAQVPLRDYLSSRIDQLRSELLDRIELLDRQQSQLLDERDRQYAQRFGAQQEALQAALQAAEKAVANALSAAKEAVLKAEDASKDKFAGINEIRGSLNDVIRLQMPRLEAEARFNGIDAKLIVLERRLDAITSSSQGATETWALIGGAVLLLLALGTFAMTVRRDQRNTKVR